MYFKLPKNSHSSSGIIIGQDIILFITQKPIIYLGFNVDDIAISATKEEYLEFVLNTNREQLNKIAWESVFSTHLSRYVNSKVLYGDTNLWRQIKPAVFLLQACAGESNLDELAKETNDVPIHTSSITFIARAIIHYRNDNEYPYNYTKQYFEESYHIAEHLANDEMKPVYNLINAEITRLEQIDSGGDII